MFEFLFFVMACYFGGIVLHNRPTFYRILFLVVAILYLCFAYLKGGALF